MNNYFWLVVLPNLDCFITTLVILGFVVSGVSGFVYMLAVLDEPCEEEMQYRKCWGKKIINTLLASSLLFFITCFIPNKKDIVALRVISVVSELKGVEQIPQKIIDKLNTVLDGDKND